MAAIRTVEDLTTNPELIGYYDYEVERERELEEEKKYAREEGLKEGHQKGLEEGVAEGIERKAMEVANNMLKENLNVKIIAKCTGISITQLEELKIR